MKIIVSGVFAGLFVLPALLCAADTNAVVSSGSSGTNQITTLPEITITATRIATLPADTSSSVTVISGDEIARSQQSFVADLLRGEPGVTVALTGQPGSQTGVFLRGANSDGTLVLVDGIPVNNAFNNAFDFSTLPVNNIERIEILRGPQSTLYGSEALGGVINIVTKNGGGPPTGSVQAEYGSFNSLLTRGLFAASEGKFSLSADGSFHSTDNDRINSAYQGINFSGHLGYAINDWLKAGLLTTYLKSSDGTPNDIFTDDPNDNLKNENYLLGFTLEADPFDWWNSKVTVSHSHERGLFSEPVPNPPFFFGDYSSRTIAERNRVDFQNIFTFNEQNKFLVGGTFADDSANYQDTYSALDRTIDTESAYAQYDFTPVKRVTLTAGGRVDDSSAFGTHATYQFGGRFTAPKNGNHFPRERRHRFPRAEHFRSLFSTGRIQQQPEFETGRKHGLGRWFGTAVAAKEIAFRHHLFPQRLQTIDHQLPARERGPCADAGAGKFRELDAVDQSHLPRRLHLARHQGSRHRRAVGPPPAQWRQSGFGLENLSAT